MSKGLLARVWGRLFINPDKPLPKPVSNPIPWLHYRFFRKSYERMRLLELERCAIYARKNYAVQIERIRAKVKREEKVKVLFIVNELSKWKAKSLYFSFKRCPVFEPVIGLTHPPYVVGKTPTQTNETMRSWRGWFEDRGYCCVELYDAFKDKLLPLEDHRPDVVFYPEVWYDFPIHSPSRVSRFAVTCYIPYFVPNYVDLFLDCEQEMHRLYWRHIVLNDDLAKLYSATTSDRVMAGDFVGLGHPMLDDILAFSATRKSKPQRKTIIYAPHWTFNHPNNQAKLHYSTFAELRMDILRYAQDHDEYNWVFKPHPQLRERAINAGLMSQDEVDDYYNAWAKLGDVCETAEYSELFANSAVMITDCGSFLSEYGATGHPIIHLISSQNTAIPPQSIKSVYDTYYKVHDADEFASVCRLVIEEGKDPNKELRLSALNAVGFYGQNAANNIISYLLRVLGA